MLSTKPRKTHCLRGHERTPENVNTQGRCRLCWYPRNDNKCEHGSRKNRCVKCRGNGICEHSQTRSRCVLCFVAGTGGNEICAHRRRRYCCPICRPEGMYLIYKTGARVRTLDFGLTLDNYKDIVSKPCYYCGQTPEQANGMGVDRVDNTLGYVLNNCVPCCEFDNQAKHARTRDQYIAQCRAVVKHLGEL
jgi:hypothetical protein